MSPHPLINLEIQKYYQNKTRFNGVYSRHNLRKIKDVAYVINLNEYSDIRNYRMKLQKLYNDVTCFDSFGVEHIPKEIKAFNGNKNIKTNFFRIQAYNSVMCGYFCIGFIDFILSGKTLTDFINVFSPNSIKKTII